MTRVTNYLRDSLFAQIMQGLPNVDYTVAIHKLVQDTVVEFMLPEVRVIYDNPETRNLLKTVGLEVRRGNQPVALWTGRDNNDNIIGLEKDLKVYMDADNEKRLVDGTVYHAIWHRLKAAELVDKYFAQNDLRDSVRRRLRSNLKAATTVKKLYEVLEPELHHFIPKDEVKANLPSTVAPVVDDLRKLGAVLPATPKAVV